jgi:2,4-dienoyl-CoA reductase-like NADH-dependent reductase (Old Yellow Enzyme family)
MARGGAGIVTVGDSPINQAYADANHYVVNLSDPFIVHGLCRITDAIHRYGALASIELTLRNERFPADYTKQELRQLIRDFACSAERCRKGGFDMVMLHGGHGHSVAQFFSPLMNKRTDEYGCDTFENRCRFANELIDAVRAAVGPGHGHRLAYQRRRTEPGGVGPATPPFRQINPA